MVGAATGARYWSLEWLFAFGCVLSLLLLIPSGGLSVLPLLGLVVIYGAVFVRQNLRALLPLAPMLVFPLFAIASTAWSEAPGQTLRYSIQFAVSLLAGVLIARRTPGPAAIGAVFCAFFIAGVMSLLSHRYGTVGARGEQVFLGLFGSKNEMAMAASMLTLSAAAALADPRQPLLIRLAAIAGLGLGAVLLAMSKSAGATISTAVAGAGFVLMTVLTRIGPRMRVLVAIVAVLLAAPFGLVAAELAHSTDTVAVKLGKDPTLTGRTYLWERARQYVSVRPVLGHGYEAFWRHGNLEAEGLWRYGKIQERAGFNFHNEYIEILVALGWAGLVLFLITLVTTSVGLVWRLIRAPTPTVAFAASVFFALLMRSPMESTLLGTFNFVSVMFFMACAVGMAGERPPR
jgi:exopolysaccharide production protein ExoQ